MLKFEDAVNAKSILFHSRIENEIKRKRLSRFLYRSTLLYLLRLTAENKPLPLKLNELEVLLQESYKKLDFKYSDKMATYLKNTIRALRKFEKMKHLDSSSKYKVLYTGTGLVRERHIKHMALYKIFFSAERYDTKHIPIMNEITDSLISISADLPNTKTWVIDDAVINSGMKNMPIDIVAKNKLSKCYRNIKILIEYYGVEILEKLGFIAKSYELQYMNIAIGEIECQP